MPPLTLQQLENRKFSIGGSDAAAACGVSPYMTPLNLYMLKTGMIEPEDISDKPSVYWGNMLEDVVADEYAKRTGNVIEVVPNTLVHPDYSFITANLDRMVLNPNKILECKTAGPFSKEDWGDEQTDQVPMHYIVQVQIYMAVTGLQDSDLAVLIGGQDYRIYNIPRDDDLIADIISALKIFWSRIENHNPPDPTNNDDLKLIYGVDKGTSIITTQEITDMFESLKALKYTTKRNNEIQLELEFEIKNYMKDNTTLLSSNDKPMCTWKTQKNNRFQIDDFRSKHPDLAAAFTVNNPTRVLRLKKGAI